MKPIIVQFDNGLYGVQLKRFPATFMDNSCDMIFRWTKYNLTQAQFRK